MSGACEFDRCTIGSLVTHCFRDGKLLDSFIEHALKADSKTLSFGERTQPNVVRLSIGCDVEVIRTVPHIRISIGEVPTASLLKALSQSSCSPSRWVGRGGCRHKSLDNFAVVRFVSNPSDRYR